MRNKSQILKNEWVPPLSVWAWIMKKSKLKAHLLRTSGSRSKVLEFWYLQSLRLTTHTQIKRTRYQLLTKISLSPRSLRMKVRTNLKLCNNTNKILHKAWISSRCRAKNLTKEAFSFKASKSNQLSIAMLGRTRTHRCLLDYVCRWSKTKPQLGGMWQNHWIFTFWQHRFHKNQS